MEHLHDNLSHSLKGVSSSNCANLEASYRGKSFQMPGLSGHSVLSNGKRPKYEFGTQYKGKERRGTFLKCQVVLALEQ